MQPGGGESERSGGKAYSPRKTASRKTSVPSPVAGGSAPTRNMLPSPGFEHEGLGQKLSTGDKSPKEVATISGEWEPSGRALRRFVDRFAERYGTLVLLDGVAPLPRALFQFGAALDLLPQEVWLICCILTHKWTSKDPTPSLRKIAERSPMHLRQIQRIKNGLCEKGMLHLEERAGPHGTHRYNLSGLFTRLEVLVRGRKAQANEIEEDSTGEEVSEAAGDSATDACVAAKNGATDFSFVARYGKTILRDGLAPIPQSLFIYQAKLDLRPEEVWFICCVLSYQWDAYLPYPSLRKMALISGLRQDRVHAIKGRLVKAGYLHVIARKNRLSGKDTNAYDFSALFEALTQHVRDARSTPDAADRTTPERERSASPRTGRSTQVQGTDPPSFQSATAGKRGKVGSSAPPRGVRLDTDASQIERSLRADLKQLGVTDNVAGKLLLAHDPDLIGAWVDYIKQQTGLTNPAGLLVASVRRGEPPPHMLPGFGQPRQLKVSGSPKAGAAGKRAPRAPSRDEASTSRQPNPKAIGKAVLAYSPYLAGVATDFSVELHDSEHIVANVAQVLRLWQSSGLIEEAFVEIMYEAKRRTRRAQGSQGLAGMRNKMAYWFRVLRELLKEQPDESAPSSAV